MAKRRAPDEEENASHAEKDRDLGHEASSLVRSSALEPHFTNEDYTVGWICALSTEYVAAQAFLDKRHEGPHHVVSNDNNNYTLGQMGQHKVVIAVLPDGSYGTACTAAVASDMTHSFPNVRVGLMVGIGGGAPTCRNDIRLGDIVVSSPRNNKGGVIYHDFGKNIQGQSFEQTGIVNQPPRLLRAAVNGLKAKYEADGHGLEGKINRALRKKFKLAKKYRRPDPDSDRLYASDVLHPDAGDLFCGQACGTEPSRVVQRPARDNGTDQIHIHYGNIASGNKLMRNAQVRDALSEKQGILCFEMEAAGLMDHFPCIIIRGICDYSDTHKNNIWQGFAAMVAAAYARDLLSQIAPTKMEAEASIVDSASGITKMEGVHLDMTRKQLGISEEQLQMQKTIFKDRSSKDEQKCHQLFRLASKARDATYEWYKDSIEERIENTCQWLLSHTHFQEWLERDLGPLVVSADPGCGKSVLAKYLIDHVLPRSATVCYFFFKDRDQNTVRQALCAVLHQLFSQLPSLIKHALPGFHENGKNLTHSTHSLWRILQDATNDPNAGSIIIVLDALDECAGSELGTLVKGITSHLIRGDGSSHRGSLRYLMTCRPYEQIVSEFYSLLQAFPNLRVLGEEESEAIGKEIDHVIISRVSRLKDRKDLSDSVTNLLERTLKTNTHRTYLWVSLIIHHLEGQNFRRTEKGVVKLITTLPKNVYQAYEKILSCCDAKERSLVRKALGITLAAARPLTLDEMNVAMHIDMTIDSLDDLDLEMTADFKLRLRSVCGLFLSIQNDRVYFLHQTAREFLLQRPATVTGASLVSGTSTTWQQSFTMKLAHNILAHACVCFVGLFERHTRVLSCSQPEGQQFFEADAVWFLEVNVNFLIYAAAYWATHFRDADIAADATIVSVAVNICDVDSSIFREWAEALRLCSRSTRPPQPGTSLKITSFLCHTGMAKRFFAACANADVEKHLYSPAHRDIAKGHEEVVMQLLLDHGTDESAIVHFDYETPPRQVVCRGYASIVEFLSKFGAAVKMSVAFRLKKPIALTCQIIVEDAILSTVFLEGAANIEEAEESYGCTLLRAAMVDKATALARRSFDGAANFQADGVRCSCTVLQSAIANEDAALTTILLEGAATIEAKDGYGCTVLQSAMAKVDTTLTILLLERGAIIEAKFWQGRTSHHIAATRRSVVVVRHRAGQQITFKGFN